MNFVWKNAGRQRRLCGREKVVPVVDLSAYRFSAKIDTIAIVVELEDRAKPGGPDVQIEGIRDLVAKALGRADSYVAADGSDARDEIAKGKGASSWVIKIEDPTAGAIERVRLALKKKYGLMGDIGIRQLDIAVDVRVKGIPEGVLNDWQALAPIFDALTFSHHPECDERFRGQWSVRTKNKAGEDVKALERRVLGMLRGQPVEAVKPETGWYWGDHGYEDWTADRLPKNPDRLGIQWRLYHKTKDRGEDLPIEKQAVRLEVSMIRGGLERLGIADQLRMVDDLAKYGFGRQFSQAFQLRLPTHSVDEENRWVRPGASYLLEEEQGLAPSYGELKDRVRKALEGVKW